MRLFIFLIVLFASGEVFSQADTAGKKYQVFIVSPTRSDLIFTNIKLDVNGKKVVMPMNSIARFPVQDKEIVISILNKNFAVGKVKPLAVAAKDSTWFVARVSGGRFEVLEICAACYTELTAKSKKVVEVID